MSQFLPDITTKDSFPASTALTGTITSDSRAEVLYGVGTLFTSEVQEGDWIYESVNNDQVREVINIMSDTMMRVGEAFTATVVHLATVTLSADLVSLNVFDLDINSTPLVSETFVTDHDTTMENIRAQIETDFPALTATLTDATNNRQITITAAVGGDAFTVANGVVTLGASQAGVVEAVQTNSLNLVGRERYTMVSFEFEGDANINGVAQKTGGSATLERSFSSNRPDPVVVDPTNDVRVLVMV